MSDNKIFEVVPHTQGWAVRHADEVAGPYATKQAAFEAAASLVENLIAAGDGIELIVPAEGAPQGSPIRPT